MRCLCQNMVPVETVRPRLCRSVAFRHRHVAKQQQFCPVCRAPVWHSCQLLTRGSHGSSAHGGGAIYRKLRVTTGRNQRSCAMPWCRHTVGALSSVSAQQHQPQLPTFYTAMSVGYIFARHFARRPIVVHTTTEMTIRSPGIYTAVCGPQVVLASAVHILKLERYRED